MDGRRGYIGRRVGWHASGVCWVQWGIFNTEMAMDVEVDGRVECGLTK